MMYKLKLGFVEYGKRFVADGTKEWGELAYSPHQRGEANNYRKWLGIPSNTRLSTEPGYVSIANISNTGSYNADFLFSQIHWRSDKEFSEDSPTERNHEQIRFTPLSREQINKIHSSGYDLWAELVFNRDISKKENRFHLNKYSGNDNPEKSEFEAELFTPDEKEYAKLHFPYPYLFQHIKGTLPAPILYQILTIVNELVKTNFVQVKGNHLDVEKKILLIEAIQRLSFPKMGILTFAFDQVTDTTVQIQFVDKDSASSKLDSSLVDLDKINTSPNENSFSSLMLKIFTGNYCGKTFNLWQDACGALSNLSLKEAFAKGASPNDAYDVFRIINLTSGEFKKEAGKYSSETLFKLKGFIDEIIYQELQEKIIINEGNFNLLEIKNIDEFTRYLKLILSQKNLDSIKSNQSEFQHFLIKGEKLFNGSVVSVIKDLSLELVEICTDLSCYNAQFAEWFVYNELVGSEDQDTVWHSLVRISNSLSSITHLDISEQFKRLLCLSDTDINLEQASKGNDVLLSVAVNLSVKKSFLSIDEVVFFIKFADKFYEALSKAFFNSKIHLMLEKNLPTIYTKSWLNWSREAGRRYMYVDGSNDKLFDLACKQINQADLDESHLELIQYMITTEIPDSINLTETQKYEMFSAYIEKYKKIDTKLVYHLLNNISKLSDSSESNYLSSNSNKLLGMLIRYASENEYPISKITLRTLINKYSGDDLDKWVGLIAEKSPDAFGGLSPEECLKCLNAVNNTEKYFSVLFTVILMGDFDGYLFSNILWTEIKKLDSWKAKQTIFKALKQKGLGRKDIPSLLTTRILSDYLTSSEGNDMLFILAISNAGEPKETLQKLNPSDIRHLFKIRDSSRNVDAQLKAMELVKILTELTEVDSLDSVLEALEKMFNAKQNIIAKKWRWNALIIPDELRGKMNYMLMIVIILVLSTGTIYLLWHLIDKINKILSLFN